MRRTYCCLLLGLLAFPAESRGALRIPVTQKDLDGNRFNPDFWQDIREDAVELFFGPGTYYWDENQLDFTGVSRPDLHISVVGESAILLGRGERFLPDPSCGIPYDRPYSTADGWMDPEAGEPVDFRGGLRKSTFFCPVPVNPFRRIYALPTRGEKPLDRSEAADVYLLLTQWYIGAVYKVIRVTPHWIYFYKDVDYGLPMYAELRFGRCLSRYALINAPTGGHPYIAEGKLQGVQTPLYRCDRTTFVRADSCRVASLGLRGLTFHGNGGEAGALLHFSGARADSVRIQDCRFSGIRSDVMNLYDTDNVRIEGNALEHCYQRGIYSDWLSDGVCIRRNLFSDHGRKLSNASCVQIQGSGLEICGNRFVDFSYIGIGIGTHFLESDGPFTEGRVCGNELYQTTEFLEREMRYLTDSGAIYVWTQNRSVEFFNNYIHDIGGSHGNRGILCDDGVSHVRIHDNLILRIRNHRCVDLRKDFDVLRRKGSLAREVNMGNQLYDNWMDGPFRFFIRDDDPTSDVGDNRILPAGYDPAEVVLSWTEQTGGLCVF